MQPTSETYRTVLQVGKAVPQKNMFVFGGGTGAFWLQQVIVIITFLRGSGKDDLTSKKDNRTSKKDGRTSKKDDLTNKDGDLENTKTIVVSKNG